MSMFIQLFVLEDFCTDTEEHGKRTGSDRKLPEIDEVLWSSKFIKDTTDKSLNTIKLWIDEEWSKCLFL